MLRSKSPSGYRFLLLLSLPLPVALLSTDPCYYHNGSVVIGDTSCRPDLPDYFCCAFGWTCLDNGICSNDDTGMGISIGQIRGSCTNKYFPEGQCPRWCPNIDDSGREVKLFENGTFCCMFDNGSCIADPVITSLKEGVPFTKIGAPQSSYILSTDKASSSLPTAASFTTSSSPVPLSTSTRMAALRSSLQTTASSTIRTASATAKPASNSLSEPTKVVLSVTLPECVITVIIMPLYSSFKRRREHKAAAAAAAEEARIVSARERRPASDVASYSYAGLGHGPQELDGPRRQGRGEWPLNTRRAQAELTGHTNTQELGG